MRAQATYHSYRSRGGPPGKVYLENKLTGAARSASAEGSLRGARPVALPPPAPLATRPLSARPAGAKKEFKFTTGCSMGGTWNHKSTLKSIDGLVKASGCKNLKATNSKTNKADYLFKTDSVLTCFSNNFPNSKASTPSPKDHTMPCHSAPASASRAFSWSLPPRGARGQQSSSQHGSAQ